VQPELHIWQQKCAAFDLKSGELGGKVKHKRSWISLLGYCFMTAFGAALIFAIILAGGSVALASHQTSQEMPSYTAEVPQSSTETQTVAQAQQSDRQNDAPAAPQHSDLATFSGLVTDSYCGARHQRHSNLRPEDCARMCLRNGAAYVLVDGDHRYKLSGSEDSLSKLLGIRASITGTRQGETISVSAAGPQL
jgi:hypothetical protein